MAKKSICDNKKYGKEFAYVLDSARHGYSEEHPESENPTESDLMRYILRSFNAEHNDEYYRKRMPNLQDRIADWLQGLPSACSIGFTHYDIAETGREWGVSDNDDYLYGAFNEHWWKRVAFRIIQIALALNIPVYSLRNTDKVEL